MPQLDTATFFSQVFVSAILLVVVFFVFSSVILPELYKIQRTRHLAFEEAEFQIENISTLFWLTHFTKRTSVEQLTDSTLEGLELLDSIEDFHYTWVEDIGYNEDEINDNDYDFMLEEEDTDESTADNLSAMLLDYVELNIEALDVDSYVSAPVPYSVPSLFDIFDEAGVFCSFKSEYFNILAYYMAELLDIDFDLLEDCDLDLTNDDDSY
jgi:hypothetical protein